MVTGVRQGALPIEETLADLVVHLVRESQAHLFEGYKAIRKQNWGDGAQKLNQVKAGRNPRAEHAAQIATLSAAAALREEEFYSCRPESYFDPHFDEFNGEFFDFAQTQATQDWADSGYDSTSGAVTDSQSEGKAQGSSMSMQYPGR